MFLVTVLENNRVIRKEYFNNRECADAFFDAWYFKGYKCLYNISR